MFWAVSRRVSPFVVRGALRIEGNHVGAQALRRHLEGQAGPGARLEEKIDDRLAPQRGDLFHTAPRIFLKAAAVACIWSISARLSSSMVRRWRRFQGMGGQACRTEERICRIRIRIGSRPGRRRPEGRLPFGRAGAQGQPDEVGGDGSRRSPRSTRTASSTRPDGRGRTIHRARP